MSEPGSDHRPDDLEPEPEMFDASNIDHAKKLAASLWAVDVSVTIEDAPPARRVILKIKQQGSGESGTVEVTGAHGFQVGEGGKILNAAGVEFEIDQRFAPEDVPMTKLTWVAKFGEQRFGEAIIVPTLQRNDGLRALSVNMVRTMLALVVNGTIGRAPVTHEGLN